MKDARWTDIVILDIIGTQALSGVGNHIWLVVYQQFKQIV